MIWIKNHGISGKSDRLRKPLKNAEVPVTPHEDDGETTTIVKIGEWTGVGIDTKLPDQALENGFADAVGDPTFAINADPDHPDYDTKAEELDAIYDGAHPEQ